MGTLMYLVKESKKERFDLGKTRDGIYHAFGDLGDDGPDFVLNGMEDVIARFNKSFEDDGEEIWDADYLGWLARRILAWCGHDPVCLRSEHRFDCLERNDKRRKWIESGTRYTQDWDGDVFTAFECLDFSAHLAHGSCPGTS